MPWAGVRCLGGLLARTRGWKAKWEDPKCPKDGEQAFVKEAVLVLEREENQWELGTVWEASLILTLVVLRAVVQGTVSVVVVVPEFGLEMIDRELWMEVTGMGLWLVLVVEMGALLGNLEALLDMHCCCHSNMMELLPRLAWVRALVLVWERVWHQQE
jgi:hypothetical protein